MAFLKDVHKIESVLPYLNVDGPRSKESHSNISTYVILLCWKSTNTNPSGVRFDDAIHTANI